MVHTGTIRILAPADLGDKYREEAEGSLADVRASYRHNYVDIYQLWVSSNESSKLDSLCYG